jgi:hypothetical protein
MYANLHGYMSECSIYQKGLKNVHMLVYIECVCLLREVVSAHCTPHLGRVVAWVPNKYRE